MRPSRVSGWALAAACSGLVLAAGAAAVLALVASSAVDAPLQPAQQWAVNGTAYVGYAVPMADHPARVEGRVAFAGTGHIVLVGCDDHRRLVRGEAAQQPFASIGPVATHDLRQQVMLHGHGPPVPPIAPVPPEEQGGLLGAGFCGAVWLVLAWSEGEAAPQADLRLRTAPLDSAAARMLGTLATAGLALAAGSWVWRRRRDPAPVAAGEAESTAEALLELAHRGEAWLLAARQHLLLAGLLGLVPGYLVLVPAAWALSTEGSGHQLVPWLAAGGLLAIVVVVTVAWSRRLRQVDLELRGLRVRLARLRQREAELLGA